MTTATMLFAQDHQGFMQTCSSDSTGGTLIPYNDPYRRKFVYRQDNNQLEDVYTASCLTWVPRTATFQTDPNNKSKVFRCPSDKWLDVGGDGQNGYNIFNNITAINGSKYFPVSYGVNADILCVSDSSGVGHFGLGDSVAIPGVRLLFRVQATALPDTPWASPCRQNLERCIIPQKFCSTATAEPVRTTTTCRIHWTTTTRSITRRITCSIAGAFPLRMRGAFQARC